MTENNLLDELASEMGVSPSPEESEDRLLMLKRLGTQVLTIDEQIAELEERVKARKKRRYEILTKDMVDLLDAANIPEVTVGSYKFAADEIFHASIKEDNPDKEDAYSWLEEHEAGDLIKYEVTATFGKDSEEEAAALARFIRERYQMAVVDVKRGVPWKRLTAWVKEYVLRFRGLPPDAQQTETPLPLDLLGATVTRIVSVKVIRKK